MNAGKHPAAVALGKLGGQSKSPAKRAASRINAAKALRARMDKLATKKVENNV
jgi:hypothetical protein